LVCFVIIVDIILKLFAANIDTISFELTNNILKIILLGMLVLPFSTVTTSLLNAEMKFTIPFILAIVPVFNSSLVLCYMTVTKNENIVLLAYSIFFSLFAVSILQFVFVKRLEFRYQYVLRHPAIKAFVINSFTMSFGHNRNNFFVLPIINCGDIGINIA